MASVFKLRMISGTSLFHARDGGELMLDEPVRIKADALHRRSGERGQKDPAQAVADRKAKALFKRFYGDLGVTLRLVLLHVDLGHIHFDHRFLPPCCGPRLTWSTARRSCARKSGCPMSSLFGSARTLPSSFSGSNFQPLRHVADLHCLDLLEIFILLPVFLDGDHVARLDDVRGDVDRPAVDGEVRMVDELPRLRAGAAHAHAVDHVVPACAREGRGMFSPVMPFMRSAIS